MRERGREPPAQYYERPVSDDPMIGIMHGAFRDLTSERPVGMGPGPIPGSTIRAYVEDVFGCLGEDACERIVDTLRAIDTGYLLLSSDKAQDKTPAPAAAEGAAVDEKPAPHPMKKLLQKMSPKVEKKR